MNEVVWHKDVVEGVTQRVIVETDWGCVHVETLCVGPRGSKQLHSALTFSEWEEIVAAVQKCIGAQHRQERRFYIGPERQLDVASVNTFTIERVGSRHGGTAFTVRQGRRYEDEAGPDEANWTVVQFLMGKRHPWLRTPEEHAAWKAWVNRPCDPVPVSDDPTIIDAEYDV